MARHLAPGGVLVVEPWLSPEMFSAPTVRIHTVERDDVVLARTSRARLRPGNVSDMEFTYLVTTDEGSEVFTERHVMGMFTPAQLTGALEAAGLRAEHDLEGTFLGRSLAIGTRPAG